MDFLAAQKLGACLTRDYAADVFRLLVNYRDISASEAASRLGLHIRTVQDFLESLAETGIASKEEVFERKRPYFRYSLARSTIEISIDLESLFSGKQEDTDLSRRIRERKGSGARFVTARTGKQIASITTWAGPGRERKERKLNLTTPQGRFLFHLPFPTAEVLSVQEIMDLADVGEAHKGEISDLLDFLVEQKVIEPG